MAEKGDDNHSIDEDSMLMLAVKTGDRNAFRTLVDRYKTKIVNFISYMTADSASAEDIAQEVFLRIYQTRFGYVPKSKFSTFLYTIARNASYSHLRRLRNSPVYPVNPEVSDIRDPGPGPAEQADNAEVVNEVRQSLKTLTPDQRTAVILQNYNGLDMGEIAQTMRTTVSAVKSLLFRAREELSRVLNKKINQS